MSPDKRVYDVAKELNITTKELIEKLDSINIKIKSHSSTLTSFQIAKVKELFSGANKDDEKKTSRPKAFVVKKAKKVVEQKNEDIKVEETKTEESKSTTQSEEKKVEAKKEKPDIRELLLVREGIKKPVKKTTSKDDKKAESLKKTKRWQNKKKARL